MSSLATLVKTGAVAKSVKATASGAIVAGKPVLLNSAGTVTQISSSSTTQAIPEGAKAEILGTDNRYADVSYDPVSGKVICIWRNDEGVDEYGRLVIGTVSGTTITWGTSVIFDSTNLANEYHTVAFDPNTTNSFVIHYSRSSRIWDIAGTVGSGTAVTLGTAVSVRSASSQGNAPTLAWNPNQAGEFAAIYKDDSSSDPSMYAYIGTVSSNAITQGGTTLVPSATAHNGVAIAWNKGVNDEFAICYATTSGNKIMIVRATVSGTSISYGTKTVLSSLYSGTRSYISFDNNVTGSFVWQYWSYSEEDARSGAGTLSGDTWTFGTSVITPDSDADIAGNPLYLCPIEFSQTESGVGAGCWYGTNGSTFGARAAKFTVSGTTLTWGATSVIDTGDSAIQASPRMAFNPQDNGSFITCNGETSANGYDTNTYLSRIQVTSTNLVAADFIGVSEGAVSNAEEASIIVQGGTATNLTGLTIGSNYYAQGDGTFATSAGTPSVKVGKAISTTSLILTGDS